MQGWIKLHRKIQSHWIYDEKRKFSKFEAWVDMLMLANHKSNKVVLGNELIAVEKGQFITSELKLMERWGWGKAKLRSFLEMLEKDEMIVKKSDRKKTTITICNYCIYHDYETDNRPQADYEQTDSRPLADTNKNVKNDKKKDYSQEFEKFWSIYPRKVGKGEAYAKWKARIKKTSPDILIQSCENYAKQCEKEGTEPKYIKHAKTFLSDKEPFKDYFEQPKNKDEIDMADFHDKKDDWIRAGGDPDEYTFERYRRDIGSRS